MAVAGRGARTTSSRRARRGPIGGSVLEEVLAAADSSYRGDLRWIRRLPEEQRTASASACAVPRSRAAASRAAGDRHARSRPARGATRSRPRRSSSITLLGRLVATAVQNIRAYEAERSTVEELRRLSALRADFVSLVSHELRSPMAAVIGAARTLQAALARADAGAARVVPRLDRGRDVAAGGADRATCSTRRGSRPARSRYTFSDVDLGELVRDAVAAAELAQDEVALTADVRRRCRTVRGDRERLRQVIENLVDNAVKYSSAGEEVRVSAVRGRRPAC